MGHKLSNWVGVVLLLLPFAASAVPLTFSDCVAGNPPTEATVATCSGSANNVYLGAGGTTSLSYTHDVTDDGFLVSDTILSAALKIDFNDDGDTQNESVNIFIDFNGNGLFTDSGEQVASGFDPSGADFSCIGSCATALATALSDGITAIRLAVGSAGGANNDFYFSDSLLALNVDRAAVSRLPEPATLALLGSMLFGIGITARRRNHC
jgi:hypothetical protein